MVVRSVLRSLPTFAVSALVIAAAAAQSGPSRPLRRLVPAASVAPETTTPAAAPERGPDAARAVAADEVAIGDPPACVGETLSRAASVTAYYPLLKGNWAAQRMVLLPVTQLAIARISYGFYPATSTPTLNEASVLLAPPGALPVPGRLPLRAGDRLTGELFGQWYSEPFDPPVVYDAVPGVAQGGTDVPVLGFRSLGLVSSITWLAYDEQSTTGLPSALVSSNGTSWGPPPGPSPVIAHSVCVATPTASAPLKVVQQVLAGGRGFSPTGTAGLVQTFRVPVPTTVSWVELGLRNLGAASGVPLGVSLAAPVPCTCTAPLDVPEIASGFVAPLPVGAPTITAALRAASPFAQPVTLTPGVDYVIGATPTADWDIAYAENSTYAEGRLYRRSGFGLPLAEETDRDLAFRLIGVERPLMAGPATPTCNGCYEAAFTAVTATASVPLKGGLLRSLAQAIVVTPTAVGGVIVPLGADAAATPVRVEVALVGDDPLAPPGAWTSSYPLTVATPTAREGDMYWSDVPLDRPLVLRRWGGPAADGVNLGVVLGGADAPPAGRAKVALGADGTGVTAVGFQDEGGGWTPLAGLSLGHIVRAATGTALSPWVMAAEHAVDGPALTHDVVQVFRVPVSTALAWVELAVPGGQEPAPPFLVSIVDPMGLPLPPPGELITTTRTAPFPPRESMLHGDTWAASEAFPALVVLEPGRDYWLQARVALPWRVASAATPTAASGVGKLYVRPPGDGPWIEAPGALAFRLIGNEGGTTDAPVVEAARGFVLNAAPSPFTRQLSLSWSGGDGRASVAIFDAGGRRVREVADAGPGARGRWTWRGEDDAGRAVPAGVYFARVTPGTGAAVHRRVVYVR